jgi:hypothetical protein
MPLHLDQVVPWGRTRAEYDRMFCLAPEDIAGGVLDCGGGPSSFTAEAAQAGLPVVSMDPIYTLPGEAIRDRFEAIAPPMLAHVRATPEKWAWTYHRDPDDLLANRRKALGRFLADYEATPSRYVAGMLPNLPFAPRSFGLAVCSHLLFLYSDLLSEAFHVTATLELCRVAREVRIFPLLDLNGETSPYVDAVCSALLSRGWTTEILQVDYELRRGGNKMLRIFQPRQNSDALGAL